MKPKYYIKQASDKSFESKGDLICFIRKNKEDLIKIKKLELKESLSGIIVAKEYNPLIPSINVTSDTIEIKAVMNTTNVIDGHMDLHLPGLWNKTVKDNPFNPHLESHKLDFDYLIAKKARQTLELMTFADLGISSEMQTEANCHTFVLERKFNPKMFNRYADGIVTEHSVGMQYVNLSIAIYDEDDDKEMAYFNENKSKAVNPEVADEYGYFWVITEAKKKEGSAVILGSNSITPTLYVKDYNAENSAYKEQPPFSTVKNQPPVCTDDMNELKAFLNATQFINI